MNREPRVRYPEIPPLPEESRRTAQQVVQRIRQYEERQMSVGALAHQLLDLLDGDGHLRNRILGAYDDLHVLLASFANSTLHESVGAVQEIDAHFSEIKDRVQKELARSDA